jgi:hypothetical protein
VSPSEAERAALQARQDALLRAVFEDAAPPPGFELGVIARLAARLGGKRAWVEARRPRPRGGWLARWWRRRSP